MVWKNCISQRLKGTFPKHIFKHHLEAPQAIGSQSGPNNGNCTVSRMQLRTNQIFDYIDYILFKPFWVSSRNLHCLQNKFCQRHSGKVWCSKNVDCSLKSVLNLHAIKTWSNTRSRSSLETHWEAVFSMFPKTLLVFRKCQKGSEKNKETLLSCIK